MGRDKYMKLQREKYGNNVSDSDEEIESRPLTPDKEEHLKSILPEKYHDRIEKMRERQRGGVQLI